MKVVNPNNTTHTIKLIPRVSETDSTELELKNEATGEYSSITSGYTITETDGYFDVVFDFAFSENDKFEFKVLNYGEVVYHGKLFATSQEPQNYNVTQGYYTYE